MLWHLNVAAQPTTGWWNDAVFYEVFVRSFKDSDADGKGDINGLIDKLDYLNDGDSATHHDLGITAIWLMPIQQSPSYHGYDVTDYKMVETDYGTNDDFKNFVAAAHARGIKVIIDLVMNHTSSQHPWFIESADSTMPKRDWYVWQKPKPSYLGPWGQQVWHVKNGSNYYGLFWSEMPDLNYNIPAVKDEMYEVARFWIEDMGVDGFRLDAIKYIFETGSTLEDTPETIQFWKDFKSYYKSLNSNAVAVGEAWTTSSKVIPYVENGGLDFCFEFDVAESLINALNNGNAVSFRNLINNTTAVYPFLQFGTFLTNHDMNRVMNRFASNTKKAKVAAELLLTIPGVPFIYYGEEIGMVGVKPDEDIRRPFQWNNTTYAGFSSVTPWRTVYGDYQTKNVEKQQHEWESLWKKYHKMISLRNDQEALRKGTFKRVTVNSNQIVSFIRQFQQENVMVVSNVSETIQTNISLSLSLSGITPGNYTLVDLLSGNQYPVNVEVDGDFALTISQVEPYTTLILKFKEPIHFKPEVLFQVDMREVIKAGDFVLGSDYVDIVGDFNGFGNPTIFMLTDLDGDSIFELNIPNFDIGDKIFYKYRINGINNGKEEFSNSLYFRQFIIPDKNVVIRDNYQKTDKYPTSIYAQYIENLSVYPNPSQEIINITFSNQSKGMVKLEILDIFGRVILKQMVNKSGVDFEKEINMRGLEKGVYLLKLNHDTHVGYLKVVKD